MVKQLILNNKLLLLLIAVTLLSAVAVSIAGTMVAIVIGLLLLKEEKWSLLLIFYYALLTFSDSRLGFFSFSIKAKPILTLVFGLAAIMLYAKKQNAPKLFFTFIPFIICGAYGLIYSPLVSESSQKLLSYAMLIIQVPVFAALAYQKDHLKYLEYFISFTVLLLGIGILLSRVFPEAMYLNGRYRGLLGNPNGLGLFISNMFLFYQVVIQKSPTLFSRNFRLLFIGLVMISLMMSGSRQSIMVVLIFYSMAFVFRYSTFLGLIAFLFLSFGFEFIVNQIPAVTRLLGLDKTLRVEDVEQIKTGSGRAIAWAYAWNEVKADIFAARGLNYTTYLFQYWRDEFRALNHMGNAHNSYLTVWLDTGVQGVVSLFGGLVYHLTRLSKSNHTALPILCSLIFSFMYESWFAASLNPFTIIVFLIISTLYIVDSEVIINKEEVND